MSLPSPSKMKNVAGNLLGGISVMSLAIAMAHISTPASAVDANAYWSLSFGGSWNNNSKADRGADMTGEITRNPPAGYANDHWIVEWSSGGHANNGHDGGDGGTIQSQLFGNYVSGKLYTPNPTINNTNQWGQTRSLHDATARFRVVDVTPLALFLSEGGVGGDHSSWRGPGGNGGNVTVTHNGAITTNDTNYAGLWLSSAGGRAGWGGSDSGRADYLNGSYSRAGDVWGTVAEGASITTNGNNAPAFVVEGIGGDGGGNWNGTGSKWPSRGGNGGANYGVTASHSGTIRTTGANSAGIIAQSIGGKGSEQQTDSSSAHNGGAGGDGYAVLVHTEGSSTIDTSGNQSFGIAAYSVGGLGSSGSWKSTFGSGSYAGDNGNAGSVSVSNNGNSSITTRGEGAFGILAQSVGGGIAAGYFNPHTGDTTGKGGDSGIFGHGGDGSKGGAGGAVTVKNQGSILTQGSDAAAIMAQSLGGLGGDGGDDTSTGLFVAVALGGKGGAGGTAGKVTVNNDTASGRITTQGDSSAGVFAQSVGGGGGAGGVAKARSIGIGASVSVAVGGAGGSGGFGNEVDITNRSTISTAGDNSAGIYAQSIGGGGGHGGSASAIAAAFGGGAVPSISVSVSVGGSGGSGANGGGVSVNNFANIRTLGTSSYGITGQSIGGGGGDGGGATSYVLSASEIALGSSVSVGASGGGAGHASWVALANYGGAIATSGNGAYAIYGQSVGGGGGSAGNATALADIYKPEGFGGAMNVSIGGGGGDGGNGSTVTLRNDSRGALSTGGVFTHGIFAQSVGGGGGNGGSADSSAGTGIIFGDTISEWLSESKLGGIAALKVSLGGAGGSGGNGDAVTVTNTGNATILTQGSNSHGIYAQSIGGGGGNAGNYASGGQNRLSFEVGVGGHGGGGGHGGQVRVTNDAGSSIVTQQDGSHGIFAQSVGGGGGNGGSLTAEKEMFPDLGGIFIAKVKKIVGYDYVMQWAQKNGYVDDYQLLAGMAKIVQDTGIADTFEKEFKERLISSLKSSDLTKDYDEAKDKAVADGDIDEEGNEKKSESKFPTLSLTVGVGGKGGSGGTNNGAFATNSGSISTAGNVSYGVFAQSVGGGGGVGGLGGSLNKDGNQVNINVGLGGSGGSGGGGGSANITNTGTVTTLRDASYGLFAQSVGGGGGLAGGSASPQTKNFTANIAIGGSGGSGGAGGSTTIANTGAVRTAGSESHAIVAQSVGGGGGAVVMNLGDGSDATDDEIEKVKERLETTDKIATVLGAAGTKLLKAESAEEHMKKLKEMLLEEASFTVHIGGKGGSGGAGGSVNVSHSGAITTSGEAAMGILAQSVGGGGGLYSTTGAFDKKHGHSFSVGGSSGAGNNGGAVNVTLSGPAVAITTSGNGAHGILAQSIGGGGGYLGRSANSGQFVSNTNATGDGGHITLNAAASGAKASIVTTGQGANGIFAQSIGGGGGTWSNTDDYYVIDSNNSGSQTRSSASGKGGAIDVAYNGSIRATGLYANAILAQSGKQMTNGAIDPNSTGGPITITLSGGEFIGGSGKAAAIRIDGGSKDLNTPNTVLINSDASVSALSNTAIIARAGSDHVEVHGKLFGNVVLTDVVTNTTENNKLRVLNTGYYQSTPGAGVVTLGAATPDGNWFDVWSGGRLDIGGVGQIASLAVAGSMNVAGGKVLVDVDVSPQTGARSNDSVSVTGYFYLQSQNGIGSSIQTNVVNGLLPGQFDIFNKVPEQAAGLTVSNGGSGSPISWTVQNGGRSIAPQAQFVAAANQSFRASSTELSMLQGLQQEWEAGNKSHAALFGHFANIQSGADYQNAVGSLSTEGYQAGAAAQTQGATTSMGAAMSCPVFSGTGLTITESQCVWGRVSGSWARQDGSRPGTGTKQDQFSYRVGAQWQVAPQWFVGATGAYFTNQLSSRSGNINSNGEGGDISIALKRQMGNWLFAASAHTGYGSYDTAHRIAIGRRTWGSRANQDIWTAGLRLRAAYEMILPGFYVRPYLDLDAVHTYVPSYISRGNFLHEFNFATTREWTLSASPAVEIGTRIDLGEKGWLRPYASIGATLLNEPNLTTKVQFGRGGLTFTSTQEMESRFLDVGAGVQFFSDDLLELRAEYKARIGDQYLRQEAVGRMSIKF